MYHSANEWHIDSSIDGKNDSQNTQLAPYPSNNFSVGRRLLLIGKSIFPQSTDESMNHVNKASVAFTSIEKVI